MGSSALSVRAREIASPENAVLACELTTSHPGTWNVVYMAGPPTTLTQNPFDRQLALSVNGEFAAYRQAQRR